jgi:cadmium resistance protein CadD (predicted permease)
MYNNTQGSVLLAVLLHGSLNAGSALTLFPDLAFSTRRSLLFLTVIPLAVGIAALLFGSKRLSKRRDENRLSLHAQREKESAR